VKEDPNEWYNLVGDNQYRQMIKGMQKSVPSVFAPNSTPMNDLNLVVEGNSFHWEKKDEK
jgi:hypothetical protein